jgi:predicted NAD/FAD-binding protein
MQPAVWPPGTHFSFLTAAVLLSAYSDTTLFEIGAVKVFVRSRAVYDVGFGCDHHLRIAIIPRKFFSA